MTIIHDLYPSALVRDALLRANDGMGFIGLKEAAAICRSPSELRYVVLGFKGWRREGGSGLESVTRVWDDMASMSGVLTRVEQEAIRLARALQPELSAALRAALERLYPGCWPASVH